MQHTLFVKHPLRYHSCVPRLLHLTLRHTCDILDVRLVRQTDANDTCIAVPKARIPFPPAFNVPILTFNHSVCQLPSFLGITAIVRTLPALVYKD
ncbi:hypothetical protein PAXRUDRAFT_502940 [Paxillus rubicundulus Ve08.2h10]|uniref:Uncharacterized protein n=1 Tax=Paxillus rubicundulus Ve08.2h10 TaxID=930991 RepID=A0A0D0CVL3_9AGAM|nr:hypothetical protein PAXRUDRAFT_502940 [Paxillus rubicundulus Ve08.2h10]